LWEADGEIVALGGEEVHAVGVLFRQNAKAVVLDLVSSPRRHAVARLNEAGTARRATTGGVGRALHASRDQTYELNKTINYLMIQR
jgi:hypothetical protein